MWPLIVNTSPKTLFGPALSTLEGQYTTKYPMQMAGAVMAVIPIIALFFIFQKQFTKVLHSLESKVRNLKNLDFLGGGAKVFSPLFRFYEEVERWRESHAKIPSEPIQRASEDGVCR